jgi:hypothetical protein
MLLHLYDETKNVEEVTQVAKALLATLRRHPAAPSLPEGALEGSTANDSPAAHHQKQVMPAGVARAQIKVFVAVTACICP